MIEDVYEPLARYRDEFREKFAQLTREKFADLVAASGIDVEANRRQCREIAGLETKLSGAKTRRTIFGVLMVLGYVAAAIGGWLAFQAHSDGRPETSVPLLVAVVGLALAVWMTRLFSRTGKTVRELEAKVRAAVAVAWNQMAPLNALYTWDITTRLIEATVPRLQFDPFFAAERLADLRRIYGWDDSFNDGRSILFAQSGVINGNPFLFGEYREMNWETQTYTGSLEISWQEMEEDAEGRPHLVTRHETLTASVEKPVPAYSSDKVLIYGNDAAPSLSFSRKPSGFTGGGFLAAIRKRRRLGELRDFSRNLDDDSNFTLMANEEFETWFNAKNRDNEVEFRLLFTALAQTQLLALMKDQAVGYGDDFAFAKERRINVLQSEHLRRAPIDTAPERFRDWNCDRAEKTFQEFNEKYFKDVYFALAPLLAIPLYQQTRTHADIWRGIVDADASSFWEHEATANYIGAERFRHPDAVTENILKARTVSRDGGVSRVAVTAHAFRGVQRVDYESVHGGDGRWHEVPVEWTEYLPVERTSEMIVTESATPRADFQTNFDASPAAVFRRSLRAYLPK